jgi:hypothetical protein
VVRPTTVSGPRLPDFVLQQVGSHLGTPAVVLTHSGRQLVTQLGLLRYPNSMDAKGSSAGRLDCAAGVRSSGVK